ncbi:MAG: organic solvent tolerance protein OstA [Hyphomicrobiales bacterium]|nr:MAG: organic solvent tolerance protein OstA [Hyphomicrobiales bacterium]
MSNQCTVHRNKFIKPVSSLKSAFGNRARLLAATALVACFVAPSEIVLAQSVPQLTLSGEEDSRMLVEADEMVYDYDGETVTAIGNVQIYYEKYTLQANRVKYDQASGRLSAFGDVKITEPDGNIITAQEIDLTDDFRDGFIQSLNIRTAENARFSAQSAERKSGNITVFNRGTYTACEECKKDPSKPPLWQIKAKKIVYNQKEKVVYYRSATFEFFGVPIAWFPYFAHPDPTNKKQTGFLVPRVHQSKALGYGVTAPFFWSISENYDLTFSPSYMSKQGFLGQAEWRHKLSNGQYTINVAGINQQDPHAFSGPAADLKFRGSVNTTGIFELNRKWKTGWDVTMQTDRQFLRDYAFVSSTAQDKTSKIFLEGQGERNHFSLNGYYFNVFNSTDSQKKQAVVHPSLDYSYFAPQPVFGGEFRFDTNITSITRAEKDESTLNGITRLTGLEGTYSRFSTHAAWRKKYISSFGSVVTPFASLQSDLYWMTYAPGAPASIKDRELITRITPTIGVDIRMPIISSHAWGNQIFEPIAQIMASTNERDVGSAPNDDAQSMVFDDSVLFDPNKFSGYDRVEGGTRANIGFQYRLQLDNGWSASLAGGRSFHLIGKNSFTQEDLTLTGTGSGLDKSASDYVGRLSIGNGSDFTFASRARFDANHGALRRLEAGASAKISRADFSATYAFLGKRRDLGDDINRHELSTGASLRLAEGWKLSGNAKFDLREHSLISDSISLAYDNWCFAASLSFSETRNRYSDAVSDRKVYFKFDLKTIGGGQLQRDLNQN